MSTETHIFFRGKLPTKAALSRAMKELGFPVSIKPTTGSLEQQSGFLPMRMRRGETGVEFDVWNDHSAVEEFADVGVDQSFERVANFRWGGDYQEAVAGMCAAAALAKLVDGVVFDEAEDRLLAVEEAIALARKSIRHLPEPPRQRKPRGPTVLKRMLAPLLALRGDLVLAPSLLLIRPVRHLMRGAEFEWSDQGTKCSVRPFIRPLYQPSRVFLNDAVFSESLENPDFEPMLFDRLAVEVFEPLGKIATIEDFIESNWGKRLWLSERFHSILLSRGLGAAKTIAAELDETDKRHLENRKARLEIANREKDAEMRYVRRLELKSSEEDLERSKERQALLARGEAAVFEHYRAWEGEVARGHKIEQAWEPAPFPAQLRASQRAEKSADPKLTPTPWLAFPATWRQDPPETPDEIRFAVRWWYRQDRLELLHPITREQAEARHRNFEDYVLATRLAGGQVLILGRRASSMRKHLVRYILWVYDSRGQRMIADFGENDDDPGTLEMSSVDIKGDAHWHSHLNFRTNEIAIHDCRSGETHYECRKMTDVQRAAYAFPLPIFGEFDILWKHISMHLDAEGFGEFP